jgi:uncharacterized membrane protein
MASNVVRDAKQPVTPLAGPYGHPFHPALVALPIGAFFISVIADVASFFVDNPATFRTMSFWAICIGLASALLAALFGLMDLFAIPRGTKAFATGITHMVLNLIVVGLFAVNALIRRPDITANAAIEGLPFALSLVAIAFLGASGWLGGKLAYRYGVRVADEATQAEGFTVDQRAVSSAEDRSGRTSSRRSIPGTS